MRTESYLNWALVILGILLFLFLGIAVGGKRAPMYTDDGVNDWLIYYLLLQN